MELKGINTKCSNKSVADALKKSGYRLREKKVSWPRMRGVAGVRIDVGAPFSKKGEQRVLQSV